MKKAYPTGKKIRGSAESWNKHLRAEGKRRANKGTRKAIRDAVSGLIVTEGQAGLRPVTSTQVRGLLANLP